MKPFALLMVAAVVLTSAGCSDQILAPAGDHTSEVEDGWRTGYIERDGVPMRVAFLVDDAGRAIFEGDIDLGPADSIAKTLEELRSRNLRSGDGPSLGVVTSASSTRWPNGVVPYLIESDVPSQQRIHNGIAHIQNNVGGVVFVPWAGHSSYVIFRRTTDPNICGQSAVGRQGGGQIILLADGCGETTVIHELGHALGFWHEQSRCDRDTYVQIHLENVEPGREGAFSKHCSGALDLENYDETSVMHYWRYAFSKNGLPTISSKRGLDYLIGSGTTLSMMDIHTLNRMYKPFPPANFQATNVSGSSHLSWTPKAHATNNWVRLIIQYEEYDYEYGHTEYTVYEATVGNTSGSTLVDPLHTWTGGTSCVVYDTPYTTAWERWYYVIETAYSNGVTSWTGWIAAPVATCN